MAKLSSPQKTIPPIKQHLTATNINRLHLRNGIYYLRARVPVDLKAALPHPYTGKREIKISLKTKDKVQALSSFSLHASCVDQMFASTRLRLLAGIQVLAQAQLPISTTSQVVLPSTDVSSETGTSVTFDGMSQLRVDQMRIDRRAEKSIQEFQSKMKVFSQLFKARLGVRFHSGLDAIQYDDVAAVLSDLQNYRHKGREIGPRTAYAYGIALASLFKFAVRQRYLSYNCMPTLVKPREMKCSAAGGAAGWKALGEPEVQKLLAALEGGQKAKEIDTEPKRAPSKQSESHRLMKLRTMLALYSGLRIEEVCSLRCGDIQLHDGVQCLSVNALFGKHVKSTSSIRLVPLHPAICEEMLLHRERMLENYSATAEDKQLLWPDLKPYRGKYSAAFSKQYGRFLRKHVSQNKLHVFHSLRKNFAQGLQREGVQRELIGELLGHSDQSVTSLYTGGFDIHAKAEAVRLIGFSL